MTKITTYNATHIVKETGPEKLRGHEFRKEFDIKEDLLQLCDQGNMAALNAVTLHYPGRIAKHPDGYSKGFCYGKIGAFGYVILNEDLEPLASYNENNLSNPPEALHLYNYIKKWEYSQQVAFHMLKNEFKPNDMLTLLFCLDEIFETKKWRNEIPFIQWPSNWEVKHYPTHSALLRGLVRLKYDNSKWVSFYLDGYDILGGYNEPYWEIYCPIRGECFRFAINEIDSLLAGIEEILTYKESE